MPKNTYMAIFVLFLIKGQNSAKLFMLEGWYKRRKYSASYFTRGRRTREICRYNIYRYKLNLLPKIHFYTNFVFFLIYRQNGAKLIMIGRKYFTTYFTWGHLTREICRHNTYRQNIDMVYGINSQKYLMGIFVHILI